MTELTPVTNPINLAAVPMNSGIIKQTFSSISPTHKPTGISGKNILSVDLGRTSTKTCVSREPGNVVFIPANVKHMSTEQIRSGVFEGKTADPLMDLWLEYQGSGYAVGQLAADFGANLGVGKSKVEDALIKVLAAAGYFKLQEEISVVLGLPFLSLEQFEKEKAQLISLLTGQHIVNFRGESLFISITKVWVMPEGYGSLLWTESQPNKSPLVPDLTTISVGIVDIGHQTIDLIMVDHFRFARGLSQSEDFAMSEFYQRVAGEIEGADSLLNLKAKFFHASDDEIFPLTARIQVIPNIVTYLAAHAR